MDDSIIRMDNLVKNKESCYRELVSLRRSVPNGLPIQAIAYIPAKCSFACRNFIRLSYTFVLAGRGKFRRSGRRQGLADF